MSKQKKNVYNEFLQDDYVPTKDQNIVKYLQGKGNNLHSVEDYSGAEFLVSMPKKYRQTVWLKKGDCLAIDPVLEGNKVKGEICCILPTMDVIELISSDKWPSTENNNPDQLEKMKILKIRLLEFFKKNLKMNRESPPSPSMMPSSESENETDSESEPEQKETFPTEKSAGRAQNA